MYQGAPREHGNGKVWPPEKLGDKGSSKNLLIVDLWAEDIHNKAMSYILINFS